MAKTKPKPTQAQPASGTTEQIEWRPIEILKPYARNSRTHSPAQIERLRQSLREFGWMNPVLTLEDGTIVAGHARVEAAKLEGMETVKCLDVTGLSRAQIRAYVIADNRLALDAGWDEEMLRLEFADLAAEGFDVSSSIGFTDDEISAILNPGSASEEDADEVPELPIVEVSRIGDVWIMGDHRVMCGNSLDINDVNALLDGCIPDFANCDPPYGISVVKGNQIGGSKPMTGKVDGHGKPGAALTKGRVRGTQRNQIIKTGNYSPIIGDDTTETAIRSAEILNQIGISVQVLWGANYFADKLRPSRCWLVWDKENTGSFADAELAWTNQDRVVKLFRHQWNGLIKASERSQKRVHPTQKPVALAKWVHETMAPKAKSVIDLFLGSASTLIAAETSAIKCFGMEMSPAYVDVAVLRWEKFTGQKARLEATGGTFAAVKAARHKSP